MSSSEKLMICPRCNRRIPFDHTVWNGDFVCQQCGAKLLVSEVYSRVLYLISLAVGLGFLLIAHIPTRLIANLGDLVGLIVAVALWFLLAFALLFLMLRTIPLVISPSLVLRHESGALTVLDLGSGEHESKSVHK